MYADNAKAATRAPLTVPALRRMKADRERIAALTAYDASFARACDAAGVDLCWSATRSAWSCRARTARCR